MLHMSRRRFLLQYFIREKNSLAEHNIIEYTWWSFFCENACTHPDWLQPDYVIISYTFNLWHFGFLPLFVFSSLCKIFCCKLDLSGCTFRCTKCPEYLQTVAFLHNNLHEPLKKIKQYVFIDHHYTVGRCQVWA